MRPVILHFLQLILVIGVDVGCAQNAGQSSSAPVIIAGVKVVHHFWPKYNCFAGISIEIPSSHNPYPAVVTTLTQAATT
jgi:hypothetical protein